MTTAARPDGPRIVDFSTHMSGPLASHLLAEMGADVIKIEPRGMGDGNRGLEPMIGEFGMFHVALGGGARSLATSARSLEWPQLVAAAARWADAVIIGARPSDAARRGLDFASMRAHNPKIVHCSISGFGEVGPWRDNTAHGQTVDAFAGLLPIVDIDGKPNTPAGWRSSGAQLGGVFAALGVYAALDRRDRQGGVAQHVSVSLWASALWSKWRDTTTQANLGHPWNDYSDLGSRYRMYQTSDGRVVLCAPIEKKFWHVFCDLLGLDASYRDHGSWETGVYFGPTPGDDESAAIAAAIAEHDFQYWTDLLSENSIPFAPVLTLGEVLASEHAQAEQVMRTFDVGGQAVQSPTAPVRMTDHDGPAMPTTMGRPSRLDEHRDGILRDLGLEELLG